MPESKPTSGGPGTLTIVALVVGVCFLLSAALPFVAPGVDARFALAWGSEFARGQIPDFGGADPAKHPLTLALGTLLSLAGPGGARAGYGALSLLSFGFVGFAAFRLGKSLAGTGTGLLATVLVLTRPEVLDQASNSGKDLPFAALVLLAASFALDGTERNWPKVLGLLAVAGLIRPEAWALAGLYAIWLVWVGDTGINRAAVVALALCAPVIWLSMDVALTGDPLDSLTQAQDKPNSVADEGLEKRIVVSNKSVATRATRGLREGVPGQIGWPMTIAALLIAGRALVRGEPEQESRRGPDESRLAQGQRLAILAALVAGGIIASISLIFFNLPFSGRFLLAPALTLVVIAAASLRSAAYSPLSAAALVLTIGGSLIAMPGDLNGVVTRYGERAELSREAESLARLTDDPLVRKAIEDCPDLGFGGGSRGRIQLGRTVVAPELEIQLQDIPVDQAPLVGPRSSAFAIGSQPLDLFEVPVTPLKAPPLSSVRLDRWTFASRCASSDETESPAIG